jgi:HPt (histidine-containing phosphotransfer) domain-containing protein
LIEVLRTEAEKATLSGSGEVNVQCGINCTYDGEGLEGTSKGALSAPTNGESSTSEAITHHVGGGICPETSRLDIKMTPLVKTYIASEPPKVSELTQLCKADESPCQAANVIAHVHEQTAAGAPATLLSTLGNVTCNALFLGLTLGLGAPLVIHGNFTYSGCLRNGNSCTVTEVSTDSLLSVLKTSHETASVTGEGKVNVHCGLFTNCTYDGEGLEATAKGPLLSTAANGEVTLSKQVTHHVGGGICPETGKLDIETHPLIKTYIASESTKVSESTQLCEADESPCEAANVISHVHEETSKGAPATLLSSLGNVTCDALFLGDSLGLGAPLVIHGNFTYANCLRNGEACTVTEVSPDALIEVLRTEAEKATLSGSGEVNVQCGINCTYDGENLEGTSKGALSAPTNGESSTSEATTHHVGGGICPETSRLDIRMTPLVKTYIST